jgi:hypothetical protein
MADRAFGVREINIVGSAGTPTISSPNNINLNGINVAISTDLQVGRNVSVVGVLTATTLYGDGSNLTGISGGGVGVGTTTISTESITVSGVSTFNSNVFLGGGVSPLQIYNGGQNILKTNSPLTVQGGGGSGPRLVLNNNTNIQLIPTTGNNGVLLYHGADLKLQTTNSGVSITGAVSLSNVSASSSVTAATFYGDGSGLTNLPGGGGSQAGIDTTGTSFFNTIHATGTIDIGTTNAGVAVTHMTIDSADVAGTIRNAIKSGAGNTNAVLDIETKEFLVTDPYAGKGSLISADSTGTKLYKDNVVKLTTIGAGVTVTGTMYATSFIGDGSGLTNVDAASVSGATRITTTEFVSSGIATFQSNVYLGDNNVLNIGDTNDLQIWHSGSDSIIRDSGTGELQIQSNGTAIRVSDTSGNKSALFNTNADANLYYADNLRLQTLGAGVTVYGTLDSQTLNISGISTVRDIRVSGGSSITIEDNGGTDGKLYFGNDAPFYLWHDGAAVRNFIRVNSTKGDLYMETTDSNIVIRGINSGDVQLWGSGTKRIETTNTGAVVTGILTASTVSVGDASTGLVFEHDGTDSFIKENSPTGELTIRTNQLKIENASFETLAQFNENSDVKLYYDNGEKFRTTPTGVVVTGILTATSFSGDGSTLTGVESYPTWTLGDNASTDYTFTGIGFTVTTNDPVLYLARGQKYAFNNQSGGSHPFEIRVSDGGTAYNHGVTNNGAATGTIVFEVPFNAPSTLYYQCTSHSGMGNTIRIYPDLI